MTIKPALTQLYRVNILPATDTKCLRANVYELNNWDGKGMHLACIPMDYRFNSIISTVTHELEIRTGRKFLNWQYLNASKSVVIVAMQII